jgi:hypothetical protein
MELLREHYREENRGQAQLAIFDIVGELLAISLEKHDVEVVLDSETFLQNQTGRFDNSPAVSTQVEYEDVLDNHRQLRITLAGNVQKSNGLKDPFMLFFSIDWNFLFEEIKRNAKEKTPGTNTLWLQCGRKDEQFMDLLFKISIYRTQITGQRLPLGNGEGFLIFHKEKFAYVN